MIGRTRMVGPFITAVGTAFLLLVSGSCARGRPTSGSGRIGIITSEEIQASDAEDVLDLIQQLRPSWLLLGARRDPTNPWEEGGPVVLVNDVPPPARPLYSIQFMSLENIREIHYLTSTRAETRFRVSAPDGAILILTNTRLNPGNTVPPDTGRAQLSFFSSNRWDSLLLIGASEADND
jgi:hypothetical protein